MGNLTSDANSAWLAQGNTGAIVLTQNQSFTFTFTTAVLNAGPVTNTVTVIGQDDEATPVSAQDSHTLTVANVAPTIAVEKTVTNINEGSTATYTYKITNTSTASTDPVTIASVIDDVLGDLTDEAIAANGGNPIVLAPGAFFSFDYTTLTALNAGTVTNVVTVSGQDDENTTASATDTATLTVANVAPSLTIDKTASATIVEGNTVTYSFTITNTSTASTDPVTINSISDNVLGNLLPAALAANGGSPIVLAPGAFFSFTYTTLTALNVGTVTNTVTVNGLDDENTPATATDSHTLDVTNATPTISVDKSAANINEGNTATYTFTIKNTSTASTDPVTIDSVNDDVLGDLTDDAIAANGGNPIVLAQNQSFTFTFTTAVLNAGPVTNTVTVSGLDDEGTPASAQDSHTLTVANITPTIAVEKTVTNISEGSTATYTYKITNTSTASTDPVTVTSVIDNVLGDLTTAANAAWVAQGNTGPIVLCKGIASHSTLIHQCWTPARSSTW